MPTEAPPTAAETAPPEAAADEPPAAPSSLPPAWRGFYARHRVALWAAGLGLPVLIVAVGAVVAPALFYDQFLCEHLWGSALADVSQRGTYAGCGSGAHAVTDSYTLVAEAVYGAIMALSLFGIYVHVIKRFEVRIDARWVAAVLPFILYGPVTRTLEDANVFCGQGPTCNPNFFAYWSISPFLYLQIAAYVLVFMLLGALMDRSLASRKTRTFAMAGVLGMAFAAYGLVWATMRPSFTALAHPATVLACFLIGLGLFVFLQKRGENGVNSALAGGGVAFLLPGVVLIGTWLSGDPWSPPLLGRMYPEAAPYILGIPALFVAMSFLAGKTLGKADARFLAYAVPLNLGIVYGHMLDAFATFIAICNGPSGPCHGARILGLSLPTYAEKHPVSDALLGYLDGWGFPIVKLLLVVVIIWVLDVEYRRDLQREPHLGGLVKMAILVLGLAPGMRDFLRLAMGT